MWKQVILHLDTIFKYIHATKDIPFIKYNPGFRRENIYRLYSEKISTSGKKIPFLSNNDILLTSLIKFWQFVSVVNFVLSQYFFLASHIGIFTYVGLVTLLIQLVLNIQSSFYYLRFLIICFT